MTFHTYCLGQEMIINDCLIDFVRVLLSVNLILLFFMKYLQAFIWVYNVQFIYAYNKQLRFGRDWMSSHGAMFSRNPSER